MKKPYQYDNSAVKRWLAPYLAADCSFSNLLFNRENQAEIPEVVESSIVGSAYLDQNGFNGQPKTKPDLIFAILATQDDLSTSAMNQCLGYKYKKSMIDYYQAAARVASINISNYVEAHPELVEKDIAHWESPYDDLSSRWTHDEKDAWFTAQAIYQVNAEAGIDPIAVELPDQIHQKLKTALDRGQNS